MRLILAIAAALALSSYALPQESYWVASRRSNDITEIDPGGVALRSITLSTNLRSAHLAPDGKVWVVRFIQGTFDIVDPATGSVTPVTNASGNPYSIAFDQAGHAWVSGGSSVEEYDANGTPLASYPLAQPAPLGITIDNMGNKWIAHRTNTPPSVSRIDATTGAVTNHPIGASTAMQPVEVVADYRDFTTGLPSHIWVIGDGSGDLAEFDDQGNFLNLYPIGSGSFSAITSDFNGHIWTVTRAGVLYEIDNAGTVVNTFNVPVTDSLALAVDYEGRIWVTDRVTFSCPTPPCPPCEVLRVDPATGTVEVPALAGIGTQSRMATLLHHAMIIDPTGDLDGDGSPNVFELMNGTSPVDPQSAAASVATLGSSQLTQTVRIEFRSLGTTTSSVMISATTAPRSQIPGIVGDLQIGIPLILALPVGANSYSISLPVPNDPSLDGAELFLQGLIITGSPSPTFVNRTSIRIWQ